MAFTLENPKTNNKTQGKTTFILLNNTIDFKCVNFEKRERLFGTSYLKN